MLAKCLGSRGVSVLRQRVYGNSKTKKTMSTVGQCEIKCGDAPDPCQPKCKMDEVASPEGSWSENYKRHDAYANKILYLGLFMFASTAIVLKNTEVAKGYPEVTLFSLSI